MRYYVVADDGQKYGPADLSTLNEWIGQGRLLQSHTLEEETTGRSVSATAVAGLNWNIASPGPGQGYGAPGGGYTGYYQRPDAGYGDYGADDLRKAWIWSVLSLVCCGYIAGIVGIVYSLNAKNKGSQNWIGPFVLSIIGVITHVGLGLALRNRF